MMADIKDRNILIGLAASGSLLAFYFMVSSLLGGFQFALDNFMQLWYWMVPLIVGFGIQTGMFFYAKDEMHKKAIAEAAASTGISATSMVACCAHHIADIAPFLGITALGAFFLKYQTVFLLTGILSNILGITYMFTLIETNTSKYKLKQIFYSVLIISVAIVAASYILTSKTSGVATNSGRQLSLQRITSSENNVEFQVTPLSSSKFEIAINTHSVQLDFDLTQISKLYDSLGKDYKPLNWVGASPGGHHRSGTLVFEPVDKNAKSITLVITDSASREFKWDLK